MIDIDKLDWNKSAGLIPAVIQDFLTKQVLMLGYMNKESLSKTMETGQVIFFSRTKNRLWKKGETSGNVLNLKEIKMDCDNDALLITVKPEGNTCHTGEKSCFGDVDGDGVSFLLKLENILDERIKTMPEGSYTAKLVKKGIPRISQKVGEEAIEVALSASTGADNFLEEAADLMYHLLLLLRVKGKSISDVTEVLMKRDKK